MITYTTLFAKSRAIVLTVFSRTKWALCTNTVIALLRGYLADSIKEVLIITQFEQFKYPMTYFFMKKKTMGELWVALAS